MSDQSVPILTKAPEEKTDEVTEALTELTEQTKFLGRTLDITKPLQKMTEAGAKSMKLMQETFLGDISFVTGPLKEVGGIFKTMGSGIGSLFGKKKKIAPKRSAMLKESPESVYITDTLLKGGENKESFMDKIKGLIPLLLGGGAAAGLAKLGPLLMKGGAIGLIVGSLIWMAIDGFKAYAKAGEWGVSKISAVIGGVLGGTGSGWKNAFLGMGKWAIMGAGIGLIFGPVGALVGGLIGAAIGGIMGFIGGEKIAKGLDAVGRWFVKAWGNITEFFVKAFTVIKDGVIAVFNNPLVQKVITFVKDAFIAVFNYVKAPFVAIYESIVGVIDRVKAVFASDESVIKKVGRILFELVSFAPRMIIAWFTGAFKGVKGLFLDLFTDQKKPDGSIKKALIKQYWEIIRDVYTMIGIKVKDTFFAMVRGAVTIGGKIKEGIITAIKAIPDLLIVTLNGAFELISGLWAGLTESLQNIPIVGSVFNFLNEKIFTPIGNIFTTIKDGIVTFLGDPIGYGKILVGNLIDSVKSIFDSVKEGFINFIDDPIGFGKSLIEDLLESVKEIFTKVKEGFLSFLADPLGATKDAGEAVANKITSTASDAWSGFKGLFSKEPVIESVEDAIIKPDGSIIRTSPQDTIVATKNPIAFADKESSSMTQNINSPAPSSTGNLETLIKELISKQMQPLTNNTMMQNITSRYNPQAIMANLTTEVF